MFYRNKNIFNTLFEAIPEGVIIVNHLQNIVVANHSAEQMFGYTKGELTNKHLNILIPQQFHQTHGNHFKHFMGNGNIRKISHASELYGRRRKNNEEFPVEIGLNPFTIENEQYVIALIIDISHRRETEKKIESLNFHLEEKIKERTTQLNNTIKQLKALNENLSVEIKKRKAAETKLKEALDKEIELNELKSKFLSLVSHEFKTPLSGILTSAMLLKKYELAEQQEKRDKHIKTITDKVYYLNNILNDFLSIERLDSHRVNYKYTTFNLSKIINEVLYNSNMLLKTGQKINIPENIDDFIIEQDEKIVELALFNLIYNAIKFSAENTKIELEIAQQNNNIVFKVKDQGIGIPEKDKKFVFNRYFRAENALNIQGTGIGLNIIKTHIENLGGTISFESTQNVGSVFTVTLPKIQQK
jgi:PAS domain S-box-containing protein